MSFFITTPIYYVNAKPHLGHAYTTIACDIAARHMRQRGEDVFFLTGTDEHGTKNARSAVAESISPKEYVDRISAVFRQLTRDINASNDYFIRTSDPQHEAFVQRFVERMRAAGDVYEGTYAGLYCTGCEAFYREADLVNGLCPLHGTRPEWVEERNWFFRLARYQDQLAGHYDSHPDFVVPIARRNEARSFIDAGLEDVSLSRAANEWGVAVPWDPQQTIYVWIDALINYASALTYADPSGDVTGRYWPARWHVLAKDILRFHAVIWPAMLLSAGYELPRQLFVHGYLTVRDAKMSKSVGNVLDPFRVINHYGLDALRYYLIRDVRFGADGDVSYARVHERYNQELANDLGNLVSRTVAMVERYRSGRIPDAATDPAAASALRAAAEGFSTSVERLDLTDALDAAWTAVRFLNRFVEEHAPWQVAKDATRSDELDTILYTLCDGIRTLAVVLASVMPQTAEAAAAAVGATLNTDWGQAIPGLLAAGSTTRAAQLFPRVDEPLA